MPKPSWPLPLVGKEFVRSCGAIKFRPRGGVDSWVGEATFCDAAHMLKFRGHESKAVTPIFRRLYSDGLGLNKIEVGFLINKMHYRRSYVSPKQIISDILSAKISIGKDKDIITIGSSNTFRRLRDFYINNTTKNIHRYNVDHNIIISGQRCIYVDCIDLDVDFKKLMGVKKSKTYEFEAWHFVENSFGEPVTSWILGFNPIGMPHGARFGGYSDLAVESRFSGSLNEIS